MLVAGPYQHPTHGAPAFAPTHDDARLACEFLVAMSHATHGADGLAEAGRVLASIIERSCERIFGHSKPRAEPHHAVTNVAIGATTVCITHAFDANNASVEWAATTARFHAQKSGPTTGTALLVANAVVALLWEAMSPLVNAAPASAHFPLRAVDEVGGAAAAPQSYAEALQAAFHSRADFALPRMHELALAQINKGAEITAAPFVRSCARPRKGKVDPHARALKTAHRIATEATVIKQDRLSLSDVLGDTLDAADSDQAILSLDNARNLVRERAASMALCFVLSVGMGAGGVHRVRPLDKVNDADVRAMVASNFDRFELEMNRAQRLPLFGLPAWEAP